MRRFTDTPTKADKTPTFTDSSRRTTVTGATSPGPKLPEFLKGYDRITGSRDSYGIVQPISEGGMGSVFLGKTSSSADVAIKFSKQEDMNHYIAREYFLLKLISHPNVVGVYDGGTVNGYNFIVTEYLGGCDLHDELITTGYPHADAAVGIAIEVLKGLEAVHAVGAVHGDIKPANIFLFDQPSDLIVKIIDFGLATAFSEAKTNLSVRGTPGYLSPEQAAGGPYDRRADLFSVGVLLYTLITGHNPFRGPDALTKTIYSNVIRPIELAPYIPPELDGIILRSLRKSPCDRFQSAKEFREALEMVLPAMVPAG